MTPNRPPTTGGHPPLPTPHCPLSTLHSLPPRPHRNPALERPHDAPRPLPIGHEDELVSASLPPDDRAALVERVRDGACHAGEPEVTDERRRESQLDRSVVVVHVDARRAIEWR